MLLYFALVCHISRRHHKAILWHVLHGCSSIEKDFPAYSNLICIYKNTSSAYTRATLSPESGLWKLPIFPVMQIHSDTSYSSQLCQLVPLWLWLKCSCRIEEGEEWQSALWWDYCIQYKKPVLAFFFLLSSLCQGNFLCQEEVNRWQRAALSITTGSKINYEATYWTLINMDLFVWLVGLARRGPLTSWLFW